jgi:hypothetical protein
MAVEYIPLRITVLEENMDWLIKPRFSKRVRGFYFDDEQKVGQKELDWNHSINKVQIFIGLLCLFLGFATYIFVRPPELTYFVSKYLFYIDRPTAIPNLLRVIGNYFPDFIHPFAFILITSGLIASDNRKSQFLICLCWFLLESVFELGQCFKESYLRIIPSWFDNVPFLENTKNYIFYGTFDVLDIISILTGTVTAFFVLLVTSQRRKVS